MIKYKSNVKDIISTRFNIISIVIIVFFIVIIIRLFDLQIRKNEVYKSILEDSYVLVAKSNSTPRGRIYDRNGILLVDNKPIKTITYKKQKTVSTKDEIQMAYRLINILNLENKINETDLKKFMLLKYKDLGKSKITDLEIKLLNERKLTLNDIERLKLERITEVDMNYLSKDDKMAAYIYTLMNKGYSYSEKIIKNESVSDYEYAYISENLDELKGFNTILDWERTYIYGDTLKSIFGKVSTTRSGIPKELKEEYLSKGYDLNDRVGISGIEYQYENYLKGKKETYKVLKNNKYEIITEGKRGNDLYLTIDINLQLEVDNIIKTEVLNEKTLPTSIYYDSSAAIISIPKTGEILALSGKKASLDNGSYVIYDNTLSLVSSPVTAGSVIKGASMAVGYKEKAIEIGTEFLDQCIKIKNTPEKCSWRSGLGVLDDINALKWSSNSYQYQTAMKVANSVYINNQPLMIDTNAFNKYRTMYNSFGLGVKTGIDYPNESIGYKGTSLMPGLLLDFSIGQYDTYTPFQLSQYINTIANKGYRVTPKLLNKVTYENNLIYEKKPNIKNKVDLETKYFDRIILGFKTVMEGPLGSNYLGVIPNSAGKTGTSQSFIDTNSDGKIDTSTITNTFVGFYPSDNPKVSIVVISPNVLSSETTETSRVNRKITSAIANATYNRYKY